MKATELWEVRQTHTKECYNDSDDFAIFNSAGEQITKSPVIYRRVLDEAVLAHNKCFLEKEVPERG